MLDTALSVFLFTISAVIGLGFLGFVVIFFSLFYVAVKGSR